MTENQNATAQTTPPTAGGSTLIEFPGVNRNRPAWRKELSERFREIQQRRALEAEAEQRRHAESAAHPAPEEPAAAQKESEATKQLGLVPAPDEPELNPLVVKALRRIERARRDAATLARAGSSRGHAAAAAARVVEEQSEEEAEALPAKPAAEKAVRAERREKTERADAAEAGRAAGLLVVQAKPAAEARASLAAESAVAEAAPVELPKPQPPAAKAAPAEKSAGAATVETAADVKPQPRKISGVIDDHWLERREAEILPKVAAEAAAYDDRAPRLKRLAAAAVDLVVVAFLCAPFAAVIELTIGDWSEPRVLASLSGILAVVLFLYHTCSVALASRTLGMKLFRLHAVDADTARVPTTWQCARRALVYLLSLATFGLGILYSLIDAEGRTAHDLLSGTVIVKE